MKRNSKKNNSQSAGCKKQGHRARSRKSGNAIVQGRDVALPAAMNAVNITPTPVLKTTDKGTVVRHREFLDNVQGSSIYDVASYAINPGLAETFPWLYNTAKNYEKYKVRKLIVSLLTNTGSQSVGTYGMAIDFNAADSAPNTEQQLMAFQGATNSSVWNSCKLVVDKMNRESAYRELFVRTAAVPSGEDIKTFDLGTLYVYTVGAANDVLLGKLYLEYEIEFFTPQLGIFGDSFSQSLGVSPISPNRANPFGTAGQVKNGGLDLTFVSGDEYTSPVGSYLVTYDVTGTSLSGSPPVVTFDPVSGGEVISGSDIGLIGTTEGIGFLVIAVYDPLTIIEWDFTAVMGSLASSFFAFAAYNPTAGLASKLFPKLSAEEVRRKTKLRRITSARVSRLSKDSASKNEAVDDPKNSSPLQDGPYRRYLLSGQVNPYKSVNDKL